MKEKKEDWMPIIGVAGVSFLMNGGLFPIVNFNPANPVDLGVVMRLLILAMILAFHKAIGAWEATALSRQPIALVGLFNLVLVSGGLVCRYLLELGEVSNSYNFTVANVVFQVLTLALVSTTVFVLERRVKAE